MKELEEENAKLKRIVANLSLENDAYRKDAGQNGRRKPDGTKIDKPWPPV